MVAALLLPSGPSNLSFIPGVPRFMLPVLNTPTLLRNLVLCRSNGIATIYLPVTSQERTLLADFLQDQPGVHLIEVGQMPSLEDQTFVVMPRELVTDCSLSSFLQKHHQQGANLSVASGKGQIYAVSAEHLVIFLQSSPCREAHVVETEDVQTMMDSAEQYLLTHRLLLGSETYIHKTAVIAPDALISPRVHIGANCYIGSGAVIDHHCCLGADCWVGADAYLHNSVLLERVRVGIQATVEDAIVALGAVIGRTAQIQGSTVVNPGSYIGAGTSLCQAESALLKGLS